MHPDGPAHAVSVDIEEVRTGDRLGGVRAGPASLLSSAPVRLAGREPGTCLIWPVVPVVALSVTIRHRGWPTVSESA